MKSPLVLSTGRECMGTAYRIRESQSLPPNTNHTNTASRQQHLLVPRGPSSTASSQCRQRDHACAVRCALCTGIGRQDFVD
jgi:hypothetical protein